MKTGLFKSKFLTKLMISYSLVLIFIVSAFIIVLYLLFEDKRQDEMMLDQQELVVKTINQLDSYFKNMDSIALRVMDNEEIVKLFADLSQNKDTSNYFKNNVMQAIAISSLLKTINGPAEPMWRINVYDQYGDYISTGAITSGNDLIANQLSKINVVEEVVNLRYSGGYAIVAPSADRWSNFQSSRYISVVRPIVNSYSENAYVVVEVQQDVAKLESILEFQSTDTMKMRIYDKSNKIIFPINAEDNFEQKNVYKTSAISEVSGWKLELTRIKEEKYSHIFVSFIVVYLVLILLIITISYIIAQRITLPLRELRKSVNKISTHNIAIRVDEKQAIDEIKDLGDAFSDVLIRMNELAAHEKKAYLLALQAQMNPHFLFNTLAVISASGMETGNNKIVNMCQQVSDMLRYVASYESSVVPFCDEITHTINYLELMKARYEECFFYDVVLNEEVKRVLVPKLILQPLVENCFNHAFAETEPPWKIRIKIGVETEYWYLEVEDNGVGISNHKREEINTKINEYSKNITETYKEFKIGGLGLVSIITRLKLLSNDVKYSIGKGELGGMTIRIEGTILE
jgi:sensor histidine kinase YesM